MVLDVTFFSPKMLFNKCVFYVQYNFVSLYHRLSPIDIYSLNLLLWKYAFNWHTHKSV